MNQQFQQQRRSVRIAAHDYSSDGAYFVTVCTETRALDWFGNVSSNGVQLNPAGEMVNYELERLPQRFTNLEIDEFIVMPDHIHVLFILHDDADTTTRRGELNVCPAPHAERRTNPIQSAALNPNQPDPSSKSALGVRAVKGEHVVHMGATFAPTHRRRLEGSMSIRTERKPIRLGGLCSCSKPSRRRSTPRACAGRAGNRSRNAFGNVIRIPVNSLRINPP